MYLITGATGRTGGEAARELLRRGLPVRALVRNPEKAAALATAGIELAKGDAGDADAVRAALKGVSKIAIILPNGEQQLSLEKQLSELAAQAGVRHIVKISSMESSPGAHNPVHRAHWESEQHIRAKGIPWTMVRPSFYLQNFLGSAASVKAEGKFYFPFGEDGAAVMTDARDAGVFVAHVMATTGHENRSYDITSNDAPSFAQVGELFTQVLGRQIRYVPQDPVAYKAFLGKFVTSRWHLDAVCDIFAEIAAGYVAQPTKTFALIMGREPKSLREFIVEHRALYGATA